jgi:hypothetical protein
MEEGAINVRMRSFIIFTLHGLQFKGNEMGVHVERIREKVKV